MPKVNYTREEVTALRPRWDLVRDCLGGEKTIKDKGILYLPKPNSADVSEENSKRYDDYKTRAVFYGVTSRTLRGLVGQVFARDPVLALPTLLQLLENDVDGAGVSLDQQARKNLGHVIAYGRSGLLTDYPETAEAQTKADLEAGFIRPTITLYDPWDIINWRVSSKGGKKLLTLVVLSEEEVVDDDGYEKVKDPYYRVLRLDNGIYKSQIWYFDETLNDFVMESEVIPTDSTGAPWNEIPFTFVGPENNDPTPDLPPIYDLASLNIAHYRNSADYEESCYVVGQPTPYFAGLTQQWVDDVLKGKIMLGARAAVLLPEGGSAGLIQADSNTMPKEAMEAKERQMVALGAKLVEQKTVQRTATEAGMEEASTTSLLAMAAKNVSTAYTAALTWAGKFVGAVVTKEVVDDAEGSTIDYELNTDFDIARLSPQEQAQLIASWQANAITFEEMRDNMRRGGIAYLDDEEAKSQMDAAGLDLGMPVGSPASAAAAGLEAKAKADAQAQADGKSLPPGKPGFGKKPAPGRNQPPAK